MTLVLRDSIGGNCKTRMVATISCKEVNGIKFILKGRY